MFRTTPTRWDWSARGCGRAGSVLGLGCQPFGFVPHAAHPCSVEEDGHSVITVYGNVTATNADTVLLNGITVNRNVTLTGGGCDIPWALKNNTVGSNFTVITDDFASLGLKRRAATSGRQATADDNREEAENALHSTVYTPPTPRMSHGDSRLGQCSGMTLSRSTLSSWGE